MLFFFRIEVDGAQWIQKNIHDIIHLLQSRVGFFLLKHSEFCLAWEIAATMLELQRIFTFALLSGSETSWLHEGWSKTYCIWCQGQSLETELGSEKPQHFSLHHRKVFVHWIAQKSLLKAITPLISAHYACPSTSSFYGFFHKCDYIFSCLNIFGNLPLITASISSLCILQSYPFSTFLSLASN